MTIRPLLISQKCDNFLLQFSNSEDIFKCNEREIQLRNEQGEMTSDILHSH